METKHKRILKRRAFLRDACAFTGLIWVPTRALIAAVPPLKNPAYLANLKTAAAAGGGGGISFDAVTGTVAAAASSTHSHTCAANAVLVVFAAAVGDTPTITGVTYNSVAMTQLFADTDNSGATAKTSAWVIHNPASGANDIVATASASTLIITHGISFTGVANSSAAATHRTIYNGGASGGGADLTVVDSQNNDVVLGNCSTWGGSTMLSAVQTSRRVDNNASGSDYDLGTESTVASGGNTVMQWTNDNLCTVVGFALVPA